MIDPVWLVAARKYVGQTEVPGVGNNPWIVSLWDTVPWIWSTVARKDDSLLPWCGAFCRKIVVDAGLQPPKKWWSAREWASWGVNLHKPIYGCFGIMKRKGGGHITIIVGKDYAGRYIGLGGNQGDTVKLSAFSPSDFTDFVWPSGYPIEMKPLPLKSAKLSESEF